MYVQCLRLLPRNGPLGATGSLSVRKTFLVVATAMFACETASVMFNLIRCLDALIWSERGAKAVLKQIDLPDLCDGIVLIYHNSLEWESI
jgi:hypothetical protein